MKREIIVTKDGSHSIALPELQVMYHSHYGALQESMHVFIISGLQYGLNHFSEQNEISIFEMGFGTGLNAFLTALEVEKTHKDIRYTSIDAYPVPTEEAVQLNYAALTGYREIFDQIHLASWNEEASITPQFKLKKEKADLLNCGCAAGAKASK